MKLLKESIIYEMPTSTEEEVADFVACHLPSEECVKTKILEINPGFNYRDSIYFKIKDKIESVIRSTIEELFFYCSIHRISERSSSWWCEPESSEYV